MRVVQVLPELNEGGVERGTVELSRELVKRGIESVVISKGGKLVERVERDGGRHIAMDVCSKNPLTALPRTGRLKRILNEVQPDIVHARSRVPAWLCRLSGCGKRWPFVTTVHGLNSISRYSKVMVSGDRVIAVGGPVREHVCKGYGLDPASIKVIERGVDMNAFDPKDIDQDFVESFRHAHDLADKFIVTSVGRVTYLKDYESLIKAIGQLGPDMPDLRALIVGGVHEDKQAYAESLKALAKAQGVGDRVVFTGSQSKIAEVYALSDVVVNASLKMGNVGRTVVEALAMGTPVIATTWPGLDNLVADGRNGRIIKTQDPDGLAQAIRALRATTPVDVRATVPKAYTLDAMVDSVIGVYEDLLKST